MIIDSHLHLRVAHLSKVEEHLAIVFKELERGGIEKTCAMLTTGVFPALNYDSNFQRNIAEILKKSVELYPDKLYPLLNINPLLPSDFLIDLLKEFIVEGPLLGVKLTIHMNARDRRLEKLCEFMEAHDIPVLWHSWYKTTCKFKFESDPSDIAYFARKFPRIRVLMAHMTAARARGIQDIKDCPNVSIDTSGSQPEDGYMEYALKHLGADRILFGSDYPCRDIPVQLGRIESIPLSEEEKEKILCRNAVNFFCGSSRVKA